VLALYRLGLEPMADVAADKNSYGFRKGRSQHDAVAAIYSALKAKDSEVNRYYIIGPKVFKYKYIGMIITQ
jgi:retron-type reverse transcriptase